MTALDFLQHVRTAKIPEHIRLGQYAFNHLLEVRPDLAERVRGTEPDPFGFPYLSAPFEEWLISAWGDPVTDWCVWKVGPCGRRYRCEETATYERDFSAEPLIRKGLTNRQAFMLAQCLEDGVPVYCEDLLPEEGQRVRFWTVAGSRGEPCAVSGVFVENQFRVSGLHRNYWDFEPQGLISYAYAWEPEPPAPPLPEPGK